MEALVRYFDLSVCQWTDPSCHRARDREISVCHRVKTERRTTIHTHIRMFDQFRIITYLTVKRSWSTEKHIYIIVNV